MFDHRKDFITVHKEAENIKLDNQKEAATPTPWHPGALKFYKERGVKLK